MELPNYIKNLIHWLNTYAFIGWSLENGKYSLDELIDMAQKEDDRYKTLLEEFQIAKHKAMIKQEDEEE